MILGLRSTLIFLKGIVASMPGNVFTGRINQKTTILGTDGTVAIIDGLCFRIIKIYILDSIADSTAMTVCIVGLLWGWRSLR